MNFALLPEGFIISHPHLVKLIKIVPSNIQGRALFVVVIRLYDSSEIMIKNCNSLKEAQKIVQQCTEAINLSISTQDVNEIVSLTSLMSDVNQETYTTSLSAKTIESQKQPQDISKTNNSKTKEQEEDSDEWPIDDGSNDWD